MPEIPATTFDVFDNLIAWLQSVNFDVSTLPPSIYQATDRFSALVLWLKENGYDILFRNMDVPVGIIKRTAVDPSSSTDLALRGITDLTIVEGASSLTQGKKTFAIIARRIAAGAVVAALGVSMFVSQIGEAFTRIDEALEDFTIDGENVPVLIDEDGKTYIEKEAIEAVRDVLIDMGAFNEGYMGATMTPAEALGVLNYPLTNYEVPFVIYELPVNEYFDIVYNDGTPANYGFKNQHITVTSATKPVYLIAIKNTNPNGHQINYSAGEVKFWVYSEQAFTFVYGYYYRTGNTYTHREYTQSATLFNTYVSNRFYFSSALSAAYTASGSSGASMYAPNLSIATNNIFESDATTAYKDEKDVGMIILYGERFGGTSVPGLEPSNYDVGNDSLTIDQVFPDWGTNGVTMPAPTETDINNTNSFYPISINNTTPLTDDTVASDTDQDGDSSDKAKDEMMQKMMNLIQELIQQQTQTETDTDTPVITPTITVEDTGDTPPAIPPIVSGASNGLWTIYNPTLSEVQQFGGWLWSENIIDQIIRQFNNPIEAVIGFMTLYATPTTGDRKIIKAGYLNSPVSAKEVTNQYITIDCGTVEVNEYYHTAIDYTQTKVEIYLPFIGIVPLDCSVVMGSTLQVIYRIDVLTGTCLAQIKVIKRNSDAVMYAYNGNCAVQLPLTASTYTGIVGVLTGLGQAVFSTVTGNTGGIVSGAIQAGSSAINNLTGVAKSGTLSSNAGALGIRIPYLIITHPTSYEAMVYNQMYGYPSNEYQRLSAMSGYVRVKDIHLHDITCTEQELDMIYAKLHEGIIIS